MTSDRTLPLFDPNSGRPPADAVELYLEAPRSLGIFYAAAVANRNTGQGHDTVVEALERIQHKALDHAVQVIKRDGSYAKVGEHRHVGNGRPTVGKYLPATLYLTTISEKFADQRADVARFHEHIYVGARARVHEDGRDWPTDLVSLKRILTTAQAEYRHMIVKVSEAALGLRWDHVQALDSIEIVDPPMYEHVSRYPHVMCSGSFSLAQRWISRDVMSPEETRHAV